MARSLRAFIIRISETGGESAVSRLDPTLAEAGGKLALEAAWRAILEIAHDAVAVVRRRLAGESVTYYAPAEGTEQIDQFLQSLPLEAADLATIGPLLVRLCHALDYLSQLLDDLTRIPPVVTGWQLPRAPSKPLKRLRNS